MIEIVFFFFWFCSLKSSESMSPLFGNRNKFREKLTSQTEKISYEKFLEVSYLKSRDFPIVLKFIESIATTKTNEDCQTRAEWEKWNECEQNVVYNVTKINRAVYTNAWEKAAIMETRENHKKRYRWQFISRTRWNMNDNRVKINRIHFKYSTIRMPRLLAERFRSNNNNNKSYNEHNIHRQLSIISLNWILWLKKKWIRPVCMCCWPICVVANRLIRLKNRCSSPFNCIDFFKQALYGYFKCQISLSPLQNWTQSRKMHKTCLKLVRQMQFYR